MGIPTPERGRDEADARFNEAGSEQAAHAKRVFAERFGERGRFLADVERLAGPLTGDDGVGLLGEAVEAGQKLTLRLDSRECLVQIGQKAVAALDFLDGD